MSDEMTTVPAPANGGGAQTAGMLLRQAREATGLHIAALAVAMKVPVKKLEALEANRLEELPDAVFVRALAASMCRSLKLDPTEVLARLPQSVAPKLDKNDSGVRMPAQGSGFQLGQSVFAFASRPSVLLVAALLLGALVVLLFPQAVSTVNVADTASQSVSEPQASVAVQPVAPAPATESAAAPSTVPVAMPSAEAVPAAPATAAATAPAPAAPAQAATASAPAGAAPSGILVFKASSRAWVRVSDSKGAVTFEKTLAAGETAVAPGTPPLSVVVGNVAATEVLLRGQPFTMQDLNQNNVARFEVK